MDNIEFEYLESCSANFVIDEIPNKYKKVDSFDVNCKKIDEKNDENLICNNMKFGDSLAIDKMNNNLNNHLMAIPEFVNQ